MKNADNIVLYFIAAVSAMQGGYFVIYGVSAMQRYLAMPSELRNSIHGVSIFPLIVYVLTCAPSSLQL